MEIAEINCDYLVNSLRATRAVDPEAISLNAVARALMQRRPLEPVFKNQPIVQQGLEHAIDRAMCMTLLDRWAARLFIEVAIRMPDLGHSVRQRVPEAAGRHLAYRVGQLPTERLLNELRTVNVLTVDVEAFKGDTHRRGIGCKLADQWKLGVAKTYRHDMLEAKVRALQAKIPSQWSAEAKKRVISHF